jgi:hypothetical protein
MTPKETPSGSDRAPEVWRNASRGPPGPKLLVCEHEHEHEHEHDAIEDVQVHA